MTNSFDSRFNKKDILLIVLIFFFAQLLRAIYFSGYRDLSFFPILPNSDSDAYYSWARDIAAGDVLGRGAFMKWPLYAYALGFVFKLFGANASLIYWVQSILGSLNCVLVYLIARTLFNRASAVVAGLLCCVYGLFIFYDHLLIYTSLSLFLNSLLFLYFLSIRDKPGRGNLFLAGVFSGICAITQASVLLFSIIAAGWIVFLNRRGLKTVLVYLGFFMLGLCLIIGSVAARNYFAEKDFVLLSGNTGFNFYSGNSPEATGVFFCPKDIGFNQEDMFRDAKILAQADLGRTLKTSEVSAYWFNKGLAFMRQKPLDFTKLFLKKLTYLFSPREYIHDIEFEFLQIRPVGSNLLLWDLKFIWPFIILGIFLGIKKFSKAWMLYAALFSFAFSITIFFVTSRYRSSMVPFLFCFAGLAVFSIWEALRKKNFIKFSALLAFLAILAFFSHFLYAYLGTTARNVKFNSPEFDYHISRSLMHEQNRQIDEAIYEAGLASRIEPDNGRADFRLGVLSFGRRDLREAAGYFKEAIKKSPYSVDSYYNLGYVYAQQMRFKEAVEMLKKAAMLDPDDARTHFELGMAYKSLEQRAEAKKELSMALEKLNRWRKMDREIIKKELEMLGNGQ